MKPAHGTVVTQASLFPGTEADASEVYCALCDEWRPFRGNVDDAGVVLERCRRKRHLAVAG